MKSFSMFRKTCCISLYVVPVAVNYHLCVVSMVYFLCVPFSAVLDFLEVEIHSLHEVLPCFFSIFSDFKCLSETIEKYEKLKKTYVTVNRRRKKIH